MKNRKLIVLDLDGTLLTDFECVLLPESEMFIKQFASEGHKIILTSGRAYRTMLPYYKKLGLSTPLIAYNGAEIINPEDPAFPLLTSTFDHTHIVNLYAKCKDKLTALIAENHERYFRYKGSDYLENYFPCKGIELIDGPFDETLKENVFTCVMGSKKEDEEYIEKIATSFPGIGWRKWNNCEYSELYKIGADKASALKYIMEKLGFEREDVIAMGDSDNDYEAMCLAGTAYCMKNCKSAKLKSSFPQTEEDCFHNGVVLQLAKILDD